MAFNFNWSSFSEEFYSKAKSQLELALNKGPRPDIVVDNIQVKELDFGSIAPDLEILEIGTLTTETFRGILKLTYSGNSYISLLTKVQINPVKIKSEVSLLSRRGILAAHEPLIMPMSIKLSDLKLKGIISLTVSKSYGITLVFKNDPLQNIKVSSSFDEFLQIKTFLQSQIEDKLRNFLMEDLPLLFHSLSDKVIKKDDGPILPVPNPTPVILSPKNYSPSRAYSNISLSDLHYKQDNLSLPDLHFKPDNDHQPFQPGLARFGLNNKLGILSPPTQRFNQHTRNYSIDYLPQLHQVLYHSQPPNETYPTPLNHLHSPPSMFNKLGPIDLNSIKSPPNIGLKDLLNHPPPPTPTSPIKQNFKTNSLNYH